MKTSPVESDLQCFNSWKILFLVYSRLTPIGTASNKQQAIENNTKQHTTKNIHRTTSSKKKKINSTKMLLLVIVRCSYSCWLGSYTDVGYGKSFSTFCSWLVVPNVLSGISDMLVPAIGVYHNSLWVMSFSAHLHIHLQSPATN